MLRLGGPSRVFLLPSFTLVPSLWCVCLLRDAFAVADFSAIPQYSRLHVSLGLTGAGNRGLIISIFKNLTIILIAYGEVVMFQGKVTGLTLVSFGLMVSLATSSQRSE